MEEAIDSMDGMCSIAGARALVGSTEVGCLDEASIDEIVNTRFEKRGE